MRRFDQLKALAFVDLLRAEKAALEAAHPELRPKHDDETIYPTHECFDDVVIFMNGVAEAGAARAELLRYTIVHAIVLAPNDEPYSHAWLEHEDGRAIQGGIYKGERFFYSANREEFRAKVRIVKETRYNMDEVLALDRELGPGPWVSEYKALCGGGRRVWVDEGEAPRWSSVEVVDAGRRKAYAPPTLRPITDPHEIERLDRAFGVKRGDR